MIAAVLTFMLAAQGPEIWLMSTLVDPLARDETTPIHTEEDPRTLTVRTPADVRAALGERESVLLCVRAGGTALEKLMIRADAVSEAIPAPQIRLPWSTASKKTTDRPTPPLDGLTPYHVRELAADDTAVYWLTYTIPKTAEPGRYRHEIEIMDGDQPIASAEVRLRVFGFTLPELPSLPVLFGLDRAGVKRVYGVGETDLDEWKPYYDFLLEHRIALSLTDGGMLFTPDTLQAHLAYAMDTNPMAVIDLGGFDGATLKHFPPPDPGEVQDPMQFFLHDMESWLIERGWEDLACMALGVTPERALWPEARQRYFRSYLADKRIPRLVAGAPHDFFRGYAERWALPFSLYSPSLLSKLKAGVGLASIAVPAGTTCKAYRGRALPPLPIDDVAVADLCDGSLHTRWESPDAPTPRQPILLEFRYAQLITADKITIVWQPGAESTDLEVQTAYDGKRFNNATIHWQHQAPLEPYAMSVSTGTLKFQKTFEALRLRIDGSVGGKSIIPVEVILGEPAPAEVGETLPVMPWLLLEDGDFPSLALGGHPAEARGAPWLCWGHGFKGIVAGRINTWPTSWREPLTPADLGRGVPKTAVEALVYPGPSGLLGTARLERLRDGLEDYEYLLMLATALRNSGELDGEHAALLRLPPLPARPTPQQQNAWSGLMLERRTAIGEVLEAFRD